MNQLATKKDTLHFAMDGDNLQNNIEPVFFESLTNDLIQDSQDMANLASPYVIDTLQTPIDSITDEQLILEAANIFGTLDLSDNQETPDFSPSFKASGFAKPVPEKDINHKIPASTPAEESTEVDTADLLAPEASDLVTLTDTTSNTEPDVISEQPNTDLSATFDTTIDVNLINTGIIDDSLLYITDFIAPEIAICAIAPLIDSNEETSDAETNIDSNQPEISTEAINSDLSAITDLAADTVQIDSGIIVEDPSITSDITLDSFLHDMPTLWICYLPAPETISSLPIIDIVYSDGTPVSFEPVQLIGQSSDSAQI